VELLLSDTFKNLKISVAGMLGVRGGGNIFAEIIQANEHACVITLPGGGDGFIECFAGDEAAHHAPGGAIGSDPIGETFAFGKFEERRTEHAGIIMAA